MAIALIVFFGLLAVGWIALWLSPVHRVAFTDVLDALPAPTPPTATALPKLIVIAPARNESAVLPQSVPTYCEQSLAPTRVIVADDQSDDATPSELARLAERYPLLQSIRTQPRPAGWVGKNWAVASAVQSAEETLALADDDIFVFTDADCLFHRDALATVVGRMNDRGLDMLSVLPHMELGPACEKIGLPGLVTVLSMVFPLGVVNNPKSPLALAAGGFIAIRRGAYRAAGGHEAVRHHVVEDVNLARLTKAAGKRIETHLTRNLVSTRMYENWADLWEGLAKNAYAGMDFQPRKFWVGLIVGTAMMVLPPLYLLASAAWLATALSTRTPTLVEWAVFALAVVMVAAQSAVHRRTTRHMGLHAGHALLMPLSISLYLAICCASAYQHHFRGGTLWKGRRVAGAAPAA
jgi:glycosyltransferase involved in cell wall biosynthesis